MFNEVSKPPVGMVKSVLISGAGKHLVSKDPKIILLTKISESESCIIARQRKLSQPLPLPFFNLRKLKCLS